jgi:hypothetical protein
MGKASQPLEHFHRSSMYSPDTDVDEKYLFISELHFGQVMWHPLKRPCVSRQTSMRRARGQ